jgi:hypothetical protein
MEARLQDQNSARSRQYGTRARCRHGRDFFLPRQACVCYSAASDISIALRDTAAPAIARRLMPPTP